MTEIGKVRYEFEELVHRKVDKVIDEIEQVKLMDKWMIRPSRSKSIMSSQTWMN